MKIFLKYDYIKDHYEISNNSIIKFIKKIKINLKNYDLNNLNHILL